MTASRGVLARVILTPIRGYQRWVSPALPPRCRFYPTCSQYAVEAISRHGAFRGGWLSLVRIAKCAPWHQGGIDHVPSVTGRSQRALVSHRNAAHQVTDVSAKTRPSAHHPLENHA